MKVRGVGGEKTERKKRAGLKEGILPRVPWRGSNDSLRIGEREVLFSE